MPNWCPSRTGNPHANSVAGFVEIRTRKHPVYFHTGKDLTVPIPAHPGDVPKGTLRTIVREMEFSVEEFNGL